MKHILLAGLVSLGLVSSVQAGLITTSNKATFYAAHPELTIEDFSEATISGPSDGMDGPLDSSTNNSIFSTGDIADGVSISTDSSNSRDLLVGAAGSFGRISNGVGNNYFGENLFLTFSPYMDTAGVEFYSYSGNSDVTINVFGASGSLGSVVVSGTSAGSPAFRGFTSDMGPISYIELTNNAVVYEVAFAAAVPEPSTFALLGIGSLALVGYGWRRKRQQAA